MDKRETSRRLRADLTEEQKAEALRVGRVEFKSIRRVDRRIEPFIPSQTQH